ncbi:MAG: tRNA lysidine(34) synthetase TilS [Clostridia bacterium]|nr:tRNA lysidine(34) synthetase TilS [Clostridia bacterium]
MLLWTDSTWTACGVSASDGVLVALSGGADSVALLLELIGLQKDGRISRLEAAHLHHAIRGAEADADAEFVRALCKRLDVPLVSERIDVPRIAEETGVSLELAARNARYAFLERVRADRDLDCIATGHHRDDQAETLLLHLLRGSGTDGLACMRLRSGRLIRPLLYTDRTSILAYLGEIGQDFCTDSTNFETDATRNRVRLNVLPVLETVNPNVKRALSDAARHIAEDADYLNRLADEAEKNCGANREKLTALPRPVRLRVLKRMLPYTDFTGADLDRLDTLLSGNTGDAATLKNGVIAWLDANDLRIGVEESGPFSVPLPREGSVKLPHGVLTAERVDRAAIPCKGTDAFIDADRLVGETYVRNPAPGDRFTPLGMRGTKLLSDYLTDRKVPRFERTMPVVCDGAGIVFVAGHTVDERMRVTADSTDILHYHYEED